MGHFPLFCVKEKGEGLAPNFNLKLYPEYE
jgi:hypothetical protein